MGKRQWDEIDEAAEREGAAFTKQISTQIIKGGGREGKRIKRQRNGFKAAINKMEIRILKRHLL
tara:strand:+ start:297 stop:488 length:192 start_codon:yes stop_codon:yes gene_type:complete